MQTEAGHHKVTTKRSIRTGGAEDGAMKVSSTFPSPPSNEGSPTMAKRPLPDMESERKEHARKKQCLIDAPLSTPQLTNEEPRLMVDKMQKSSKRSLCASVLVASNTDCQHTYASYNNDSIPVLHSALIQRRISPDLLNNPSVELKVQAHILLERAGGFTSEDMGRCNVPKSGRTKVINNVDLYLMEDGKIYVATERGLLLAAHYVKLAGIADTTPVRFNGVKPAWVKASIARRFSRKVGTTTENPDAPERENPFPPLPRGDLGLMVGYVVQVYERHPTNGRAFGRRVDNDKLGWFDYDNTTELYAPYPEWEGLWTSDVMVLVSANPVINAAPSRPRTIPAPSARLSAPPPVQAPKVLVSATPPVIKSNKQAPGVSKTKDTKNYIISKGIANITECNSKSGVAQTAQETIKSCPALEVKASVST
jgi:hypothetical protein